MRTFSLFILLFCCWHLLLAQEQEPYTSKNDYWHSIAVPLEQKNIMITMHRNSTNNYFKVWDLAKGEFIKQYQIKGIIHDWSDKNHKQVLLLVQNKANHFEVWNAQTRQIVKKFQLPISAKKAIHSIAIAPDLSFVAFMLEQDYNKLKVWDIQNNRLLYEINDIIYGNHICISPNAEWIVLTKPGPGFAFINHKTQKYQEHRYPETYDGSVHDYSFSADGKYFAVAADEIGATLIKMDSPDKEIFLREINDESIGIGRAICISPNQKEIAVYGNSLGGVFSLSGKLKTKLQNTLDFHSFNITANGKYLLTIDKKGAIRTYEMSSGNLYLTFLHSTDGMIIFSPDGTYSATEKAKNQIENKNIRLQDYNNSLGVPYTHEPSIFKHYNPDAIYQKLRQLSN
ncbi:WD40 repeat domain-containing protein [Raineya sp.]|jgi:WD40 repeat protein